MVIGAGITGLVAARQLAKDFHEVVLLEASDRLGGQVHGIPVGPVTVDMGAESAHLGASAAATLIRELGLDSTVVSANPGQSLLLTRRGLKPLPAGVGPTGPTRLLPVLRSGILTLPGLARAGMEPLLARRRYDMDMGVGDFIERRFGTEVAEVFVDPMLGNLHGGEVRALSLHATAPQLKTKATGGMSIVLESLRRRRKPPAAAPTQPQLPMFASWPEGLSTLIEALANDARRLGVDIRTSSPVTGLQQVTVHEDKQERDGHHGEGNLWQVTIDGSAALLADQVVVAVPGPVISDLVSSLCPEVKVAMSWVRMASVASVLLGYDKTAAQHNKVLREANGILLNSRQERTFKAATNLTRKWPHLAESPHHLVRLSVGRSTHSLADDLSDDEMIERCHTEFSDLIGFTGSLQFGAVVRWPRTMPQLGVGHLRRMAAARAALERLPGLHLAGSSIDGLGVGATIRSGVRAAEACLTSAAASPGKGHS